MPGHEDAPQGRANEERDALIVKQNMIMRWTHAKIARHHGLSQQRVSQIIADARAALPAVEKAELVRDSITLYNHIVEQALELAEMEGAPVTAGKDGDVVLDPVTGAVVRDYGGRMAALKLARDTDAELRKLLGLDAATKIESMATVKYEVVGVDPEALK